MATLSSLQDRLQGIGNRLKAENEAHSRDRMNVNLSLDFSRERAGSERRPRPQPFPEFQIPGRPNTISARPRGERPRIEPLLFQPPRQQQDSPELSEHVKEIARKNGIITLNGKQYKSTIDDMKYISELGNGTSGSVVKMIHSPSEKYIAVKQMHRSGNLEEAKRVFFDLEVVLKSHDCPYIVQCLGCFVTDTDVWICMELMATCLDKLIKKYKQPFPEPIIGKIAVATVKALNYLKESHGVIHRDVKPSNILLDEKGNIKLCDFGISGRLVDSKANTRSAGCAAYMAPERIDPPDPNKPDYDIRADVWSLGITLVELATGQFPYRDCRTDFEVLTKVLQDAPPCLPPDKDFSNDFREFVKDCLVKDYKHRPKYKKLLEYPFIKEYEKERVDVSKWFTEVSRIIEDRAKAWPHIIRSSRSGDQGPCSLPIPDASPTPPPVAPRRRSRTPDTQSQERFNQLSHLQNCSNQKPPAVPSLSNHISSMALNSSNYSGSLHGRIQVPSASPVLNRTVASAPTRNIPPPSPIPSRVLCSSPRTVPSDTYHFPHISSHYFAHLNSTSFPSHQYGVPTQPGIHNYNAKSFSSTGSQGYTQYCNPYSPALPPRVSHNNSSSLNSNASSQSSNSSSSSGLCSTLGENVNGNIKPSSYKFHYLGSNCTKGLSGDALLSSFPTSAPTVSTSSMNSTSLTPQVVRKTPEPVRFNPEPWAPRGRFTQPTQHHFRSLSHDLSSSSTPKLSFSRYPLSYLSPHVSPLVSRRIVESKVGTRGMIPEKVSQQHLSVSSATAASGATPGTSIFSTPHYRYTQEAYYNSRPYYTPEPQRRIFPRTGNL